MAPATPDPLDRPLLETARRAAAGLAVDPRPAQRLGRALAGPLTVVGAGGSRPVARLWAALHRRAGHPARAPSPAGLRESPPDTPILILSASGKHPDILGAAEAGLRAGVPVHAVTTRADAPLVARVRAAGHVAVVVEGPAVKEGLAARHAPLPMAVLAARMYGVDDPAPLFAADGAPDAFAAAFARRPADVVALGAGPARPAADAFAHLMRESGLAPARSDDPREFAHGQFMAVRPATRLVVFGLVGQRGLDPFIAALPAAQTRSIVETRPGVAGAVALYARAVQAAGQAMRAADTRPGKDAVPPWGAALYRMGPG